MDLRVGWGEEHLSYCADKDKFVKLWPTGSLSLLRSGLAILPIFLTLSQNVSTWLPNRTSPYLYNPNMCWSRLSLAHPRLMAWDEGTTMAPKHCWQWIGSAWTSGPMVCNPLDLLVKNILKKSPVEGWQTLWKFDFDLGYFIAAQETLQKVRPWCIAAYRESLPKNKSR